MYIIIMGGGRVGRTVAEELLGGGHEVLVIERSQQRCEDLREDLGSMVVRGDGCEASLLADAGAERADLFIAVTAGDEDNLVACQVAQHRFKVPKVIARVNTPRNEAVFRKLGITATVNAAEVLAQGILRETPGVGLARLAPFPQMGMNLISVRIPKGAPAVGKAVTSIALPPGAAVTLLVRAGGAPVTPGQDVLIEAEDEVLLLTPPDQETALVAALVGRPG